MISMQQLASRLTGHKTLYVIAALLLTFVLLGLMGMPHREPKLSVVSFDEAAIKAQLIAQLAQKKLSDEQIGLISQKFKERLSKVLNNYASQKQVVIVNASLVVAGGKDITKTIAKELSQAMREAS